MTGKVNSRPLRRPVTVMSASRPLTTPCSGERSSIRTSGLPTRLATAKGAWPLGIPGDATGRRAPRQVKETVSRAIRAPSLSSAASFGRTRPAWATGFQAYNVFANSTTAVWALFDKTPLGVLDLLHVSTDVVLHFVVSAVSLAVLAVQLRRDRVAPRRVAA